MDRPPNVVPAAPQSTPRQMSMTFDAVELQGMSSIQRSHVVRQLASLLAQAAGVTLVKERDDDEH